MSAFCVARGEYQGQGSVAAFRRTVLAGTQSLRCASTSTHRTRTASWVHASAAAGISASQPSYQYRCTITGIGSSAWVKSVGALSSARSCEPPRPGRGSVSFSASHGQGRCGGPSGAELAGSRDVGAPDTVDLLHGAQRRGRTRPRLHGSAPALTRGGSVGRRGVPFSSTRRVVVGESNTCRCRATRSRRCRSAPRGQPP